MKKCSMVMIVASVIIAFAAGPAMAGGFRIPESGAKAMGMGNAFVGQADDPSAVQFNPAGITQLDGNQILIGGTSITTNNDYTDPLGTKSSAEEGSFFPPFFYYSNHLGDGKYWLGFGVTSPFGLGTEWDVDTFNYVATKTTLEMVKINPSIAYMVNEKLSIAAGIDYYDVTSAEFQNDIASTIVTIYSGGAITGQVGGQKLEGDGTAYGFNVGALYKPTDRLKCGFSYRTGTEIDVDGDVSLFVKATGTEFTTFKASTTLNLPATAALGINYKISDAWQVNFDLDWTGWSAYDKLEIKDETGDVKNPLSSKKDYDDTIAYRLGVEYAINGNWAIRGGFLMEPTPVPEETYDPRLPDGDRTGYVVGAGYSSGPWTADLAYMIVKLDKYDVDSDVLGVASGTLVDPGPPPVINPTAFQVVDGEYEGDITLIGFSVGYAF